MIDKPDNINKLKHLYIKKMSNRITGESYKLGKCFQIYNKDNYLNIYFFKVKKKSLRNLNTPVKIRVKYTRGYFIYLFLL